jgi:hypothetical protein
MKEKMFCVEMHEWNERIPDNGIWMSDAFDGGIEAESEEEALSLALEFTYDDGSYWTDEEQKNLIITDDIGCHCIKWTDENGDWVGYTMRAREEDTEDDWTY